MFLGHYKDILFAAKLKKNFSIKPKLVIKPTHPSDLDITRNYSNWKKLCQMS